MKTLHLTLKKKWFGMIASGEKKEEYRECKPYWNNRLCEFDIVSRNSFTSMQRFAGFKYFDTVTFKNGYAKDAPTMVFEFKGIEIGQGKPQWGAPQYDVFIIKLGDRL